MVSYIIIAVIVICVLYLLAIMPKVLNRNSDQLLRGYVFAHRGYYDNKTNAPENSLPAFKNAVGMGYAIELDVQVTKDDVVVVFHDTSLLRMCNVDKKVGEITYKELQEYKLLHTDCTVPTFIEVLKLVDGRVPLLVELKIPNRYKRTCELVNKLLLSYKGVYCVESFNPLGLIWYRRNNREVLRGQLSSMLIKDKEKGNKFLFFLLQNLMFNWLAKPDFISYNLKYRKSFSFQICTKLYKPYTFAWTVRSEEQEQESKEDFQYIIFEKYEPKR